jgi:AbrB family transcriptional regulator, transcriptional pleiotropic regulator of transition state genes
VSDRFITTRKVDECGRVVLPQEARNILGIDVGIALDVTVSDNKIVLEKHHTSCAICNTTDCEFKECNEKVVCIKCIEKLNK